MSKIINTVCKVLTATFIVLTAIVVIRFANHEKAYQKWLAERNVTICEESPAERVYLREMPLIEVKEPVKEETFIPVAEIPLEREYQEHIKNKCKDYGVDEAYVYALIESESTFRKGVIGDGGESVGLCQIKSCNWKEMSEMGLSHESEMDCITYCIHLVHRYLKKYESYDAVTACYKCGEYGASKHGYFIAACVGVSERAEYYKTLIE